MQHPPGPSDIVINKRRGGGGGGRGGGREGRGGTSDVDETHSQVVGFGDEARHV